MSTEAAIKEKVSYFEELEAIRAELDKCMKCGNCMAVCPVYGAEKLETSVTRSKIAVAEAVLDGQLELDDPQVYEMLFNCLVCKSCMSNCPTQVNFERIMLALRAALVRKKRVALAEEDDLRHPETPEVVRRWYAHRRCHAAAGLPR